MAKQRLPTAGFIVGLGVVVAIFSPKITIGQSSNPCYPSQNFSQTSATDAAPPSPPAAVVAVPAPPSTPEAEDNFSFDGLMRWVAPNTYGQWVAPPTPSPAARNSSQLNPTGSPITLSSPQLKTLSNLKPGGGQGVETMWKLLGSPTRVDLDSQSGTPVVSYWDTDGGTVIGVLDAGATRYEAVKLN